MLTGPKTLDTRSLSEHPNLPQQTSPIGFMLRLADALHDYGMTAYELEGTMERVGDTLGYEVECLSQPTNIIMSFSQEHSPDPTTYVFRVAPGEIQLEKLLQVRDIVQDVLKQNITVEQGSHAVLEIHDAPDRYGSALQILGFGFVSGAIARVLGGNLNECAAALVIGLFTGLLAVKLSRFTAANQLFPIFSAGMAAVFSAFLAHFGLIHHPNITTLSGVIVLVPGLLLTTAIAELSSQHMVSGTARLFAAGTIFMQIGFGMAIGNGLGAKLFSYTLVEQVSTLPGWTSFVAVSIASIGLFFLFQARPKDLPWVIIAGLIAFSATKVGSEMSGPIIGAMFGAFCMGLTSNIFERLSSASRFVMLMPGIILLVPGSIGVQSLSLFAEHDVVAGLDTAFKMSFVGIALVTGLFMASSIVRPREMA